MPTEIIRQYVTGGGQQIVPLHHKNILFLNTQSCVHSPYASKQIRIHSIL